MAKKSLNPLEDPPTASSSDDEEVGSSAGEEEEEVSSSEEDNSPVKSAAPVASSAKPAAKQASDSESGSETETDSDSESERAPNPPPVKPAVPVAATAAKPKKDAQTTQDTSAALALPAVKSTKKRPSEGTSSRDANAKRAKNGDGEDTKKPAFQRLWTEDDEIAVLQGMIDFKNDTGKSPYDDTNVFYEFIKESISFEVSKNQFMDKIRSLKKKYMGKEKNGAEKSFSKAHDQKSLALSKFIWGPEGMGLESAVKSNGVSKKSQTKTKKADSVKVELFASPNGKQVEEEKVVDAEPQKTLDWFDKSFIVQSLAGFGVDEQYVKQKWRMVPNENKKKIEEELNDLQTKEIEFVMQKTKFLHEVASMITEASKK